MNKKQEKQLKYIIETSKDIDKKMDKAIKAYNEYIKMFEEVKASMRFFRTVAKNQLSLK